MAAGTSTHFSRKTLFNSTQARNQFYGGQIGAEGEYTRGRWFVDLPGKFALGDNHETAAINGTTTQSFLGMKSTVQSGPFALPSNIGHYNKDTVSFVPEVGIDIGYQITPAGEGGLYLALLDRRGPSGRPD